MNLRGGIRKEIINRERRGINLDSKYVTLLIIISHHFLLN
jgi:hypothetical protein